MPRLPVSRSLHQPKQHDPIPMHFIRSALSDLPDERTESPPDELCSAAESAAHRRRDDVVLLRRVAGRDQLAFAQLYDRFSGPMFSLIVRIVRCHAEAEDILQDAFVIIWTRAASYRSELGSPFVWVAAIVRHKAIDRIRSTTRHRELIEADLRLRGEETDVPTAAGALAATENSRLVRSALGKLGDGEVRAIELAFFGGRTHGEIAVDLGIPVGTVKARIRRGLLKLRPALTRLEAV